MISPIGPLTGSVGFIFCTNYWTSPLLWVCPSALIGRFILSCYLYFFIMLFNVSVDVCYDEYNTDDWSFGPDDDFVPAEYNSIQRWYTNYNNVTWDDVMNIQSSWASTPGYHVFNVFPVT